MKRMKRRKRMNESMPERRNCLEKQRLRSVRFVSSCRPSEASGADGETNQLRENHCDAIDPGQRVSQTLRGNSFFHDSTTTNLEKVSRILQTGACGFVET
jgi:hypothetical protein